MVFTNVYNPRSAVTCKDDYRDTLVKCWATIGANAIIVCSTTICMHAFMAAGAVVSRDAKAYATMAGVPARQICWMSDHGERLTLPMQGDGCAVCPATGKNTVLMLAICPVRRSWNASRRHL